MENCFLPANILLPKSVNMDQWAVIACDQFSAQPEYWEGVEAKVGAAPSTLRLVLPEALLGTEAEAGATVKINQAMADYLKQDLFETYENSFVYVERTLENGTIRKGLVGKLDLEAYDFSAGSASAVRATENTVVERIPPRKRVRQNAPLELPHVLVLADDHEKVLIEPIGAKKDTLQKVYDFDLMEGGGHITGWLVQGQEVADFGARLTKYAETAPQKYEGLAGTPMVFAMGDGNHSLATAKACYEEAKAQGKDTSKSRYALVELENIHDEAQAFEPIHRVIMNVDGEALLAAVQENICGEDGYPVDWYLGEKSGTVYLDKAKGQLAVGVLQKFLDDYMTDKTGEIEYIHGDSDLKELAQKPNHIGFLLPAMEKSQLFRGVIADGVLPRKTFSMGHAREKRYYLESRKIK